MDSVSGKGFYFIMMFIACMKLFYLRFRLSVMEMSLRK